MLITQNDIRNVLQTDNGWGILIILILFYSLKMDTSGIKLLQINFCSRKKMFIKLRLQKKLHYKTHEIY